MEKHEISLALYSVRQAWKEDWKKTLRRVREIGYRGVEFFWDGTDAAEMRRLLDELDLRGVSVHAGVEIMTEHFEEVVAFCQTTGCAYVVCPMFPEKYRDSVEGFKSGAAVLAGLGPRLRERGLTIAYHNHDIEFKDLGGGSIGFDVLYEANRDLQGQIDVYWVRHAGYDPVTYIERLSGRLPLLHLKDMEAGPERFFAEIGEGVIDWKTIIESAERAGVRHFIVEQDSSRRDTMESAAMSFANLKRMGAAL